MHLPRLRIATQLSLLLTVAVALAVLAVGALSVWNLRSGFIDYLRVRDDEQFTRFVQVVERRAAADPSMAWLRDDREAMRDLMDTFNGRPLRGRRPPPPPPGRDDMPPHPPPPPPASAGGNLGERITITDMQGQRLAGRPQPAGAHRTVRAIKVDGVEVAMAELVAEPEPAAMDIRFLQRQYAGLAGAGVVTVIIALLIGWWVAGRWSRPLRELQRATQRIARGEKVEALAHHTESPTSRSGALEIDQLVADVNAMALALTALEDARRTWIAQISHELRTPLAVLRGELESIEDGARQPTPAVIRSLGEEVAQLNRLVDDLHTLTMADLGQMACEPVAGDANAALQRMAHKFDTRAEHMGLSLTIHPAAHAIAVDWDFGRIEQLLSNLLENSLRYTHAPGRIEVRWEVTAQTLQLVVQDSAPGVSAGNLSKLFDPLFRVDAARTRTGQHGSGLGLSIVRAIARAHRGHVQAVASPLGGMALQVELPLHPHLLDRRKTAT
jgi:two-component system sensor histidine kinase BaeS